MFSDATTDGIKLKAAFCGVGKAGKSRAALHLANIMLHEGLGRKIAVLDTEGLKSKWYTGASPDGYPWKFSVSGIRNFSPQMIVESMKKAESEGADIVIVDSISHEWVGRGGALEMHKEAGGNFPAWGTVKPKHNDMLDYITTCNSHVFCTVRAKPEFIVEEVVNDKGKTVSVPREIGTAPVQQKEIKFEFDLFAMIEKENHKITIDMRGENIMPHLSCERPGADFWRPLIDWLKGCAPVSIEERIKLYGESIEQTFARFKSQIETMTKDSAAATADAMRAEIEKLPAGYQDTLRALFAKVKKTLA